VFRAAEHTPIQLFLYLSAVARESDVEQIAALTYLIYTASPSMAEYDKEEW